MSKNKEEETEEVFSMPIEQALETGEPISTDPSTGMMPEDLKETLRFVIGDKPSSLKGETQEQEEKPKASQEEGLTPGQRKFIESRSKVEIGQKFTNHRVYVLDLTSPEDAEKYEELLDIVADPDNNVSVTSGSIDPQIMLDEKSGAGFRAIVSVIVAEITKYEKVTSPKVSVTQRPKRETKN